MHFHHKSKQFFYILSGEAEMKFKDKSVLLKAGTGIEVSPTEARQMQNVSDAEVEFMVVSMPKSHGDRELVKETTSGLSKYGDLSANRRICGIPVTVKRNAEIRKNTEEKAKTPKAARLSGSSAPRPAAVRVRQRNILSFRRIE